MEQMRSEADGRPQGVNWTAVRSAAAAGEPEPASKPRTDPCDPAPEPAVDRSPERKAWRQPPPASTHPQVPGDPCHQQARRRRIRTARRMGSLRKAGQLVQAHLQHHVLQARLMTRPSRSVHICSPLRHATRNLCWYMRQMETAGGGSQTGSERPDAKIPRNPSPVRAGRLGCACG
jgi:hypothetical protein